VRRLQAADEELRGGENKRGKSARAFLEFGKKCIEDTFDVLGDVAVPYTHNAVADPLQLLLPLAISGDLVGLAVRAAIDFDNQACLAAEEICVVGANGHLAEEFEAAEPPITEMGPELRFGGYVRRPENAGAVRFPGLRSTHGTDPNKWLPLTLTLSPFALKGASGERGPDAP
jgi:hypothetical protein